MLTVKNIHQYRKYYQENEANSEDPKIDIDFVGCKSFEGNRVTKLGFFSLVNSPSSEDEAAFLRSVALNIAADHQAVYELIQNADDAGSKMVLIYINEDFLLAVNTGKPFKYAKYNPEGQKNSGRVASILKFGQSDKRIEDIGTFGIGFKIVHRLLGEDDAADAIVKDYKGPIVFSWFAKDQFQSLISTEGDIQASIEKSDENEKRLYPWLFKILLTCFPVGVEERVKNLQYQNFIPFTTEEFRQFQISLKTELDNLTGFFAENELSEGSVFFVPLGKGKYNFIRNNLTMLNRGVSYSFNFLKNLERIYFQGMKLDKSEIETKEFVIKVGDETYNEINPRVERDIEFTFAFFENYQESEVLIAENALIPNFYNYFAMEEECNQFRFLVHCNAFDMHSDRRKLQPDSEINQRLLPQIASKIAEFIMHQKDINSELYLNLFAALLLSPAPTSKRHINEYFFDELVGILPKSIPTKQGYADDPEKVKIKNTTLPITLKEFGFEDHQWYYWNAETDEALLKRSSSGEAVLTIEKWDSKDIIEKASIQNLNTYFLQKQIPEVFAFLKDLCKDGDIRSTVSDKLLREVAFIPFQKERKSLKQVKDADEHLLCIGFTSKHKALLKKVGFNVSDIDFEGDALVHLKGKIKSLYLTDKELFEKIRNKVEKDSLFSILPETRRELLNVITDHETGCVFSGVVSEVGELKFFRNKAGNLVAINKLISSSLQVPDWLAAYQPQLPEIKGEKFFIKEPEVYNTIIVPFWDEIIKTIPSEGLGSFFADVKKYYDLTDPTSAKPLKKQSYLSTNQGWMSDSGNYYYDPSLKDVSRYKELITAFSKLSSQGLPDLQILPFLEEEPFKTEKKKIGQDDLSEIEINLSEADAALVISLDPEMMLKNFCISADNSSFRFSHLSIKPNLLQVRSNSRFIGLSEKLSAELSWSIVPLPSFLSDHDKFIPTDEELISRIIQEIDPNEFLEDILELQLTEKNFKQLVSKSDLLIEIDPETEIDLQSNLYKLFSLFSNQCQNDDFPVDTFKSKIRIKLNEEWKALPTESKSTNVLKYSEQEFKLSELVPQTFKLIGYLESIKTELSGLGLNIMPINKALGLSSHKEETDADHIYELMKSELEENTLKNSEQLKFISSYLKANSEKINPFKVIVKASEKTKSFKDQHFVLNYSGSFTDMNSLLDMDVYQGFDEYISINNTTSISKEPHTKANGIVIAGVKTQLEESEKAALLEFFYNKWCKYESVQKDFRNFDESGLAAFLSRLGLFGHKHIYPEAYALKEEKFPEFLKLWVAESGDVDQGKLQFLSVISILTIFTPQGKFRKYLLGQASFEIEVLNALSYQDLALSMKFIVQEKKTFESREENFKKIISRINDTASNENEKYEIIKMADEIELDTNSTLLRDNEVYEKWVEETGTSWEIKIYRNGNCPFLVKTNKTGDFCFYTDKTNDFCVIGTTVYAHPKFKDDIFELLQKAEISTDELIAYSVILHKMKDNDPTSEEDEQKSNDELFRKIEKEMKNLGLDIPEEDQKSINYEAMVLGWKYLQRLGFGVEEAVLGAGFIDGIGAPDGSIVSITVRSGRNGVFFLKEDNWVELKKPDKYLMVYRGNGMDGLELLKNQEELLEKFTSNSNYNLFRIPKESDPENLTRMIEGLTKLGGEGHFIFLSNNGSSQRYNSIFSEFKNVNTEGGFDSQPSDDAF